MRCWNCFCITGTRSLCFSARIIFMRGERPMRLERPGRWLALGEAVLGFACGGKEGGGTGPCTPGAATQLVKNAGDAQDWFFNNPLPAALSVKALDASNCAVPGVVVNWGVAAGGGGAVAPAQSTTNASGIASATDSIGSTSPQKVTATFTGLATPDTFTVTAKAPSITEAVDVRNNNFNLANVVIQTGGTVTWTQTGVGHNVTFTGGPTPLP